MRTKRGIAMGLGLGALVLILAGLGWWVWSWGEATYHPGDVGRASARGLGLDPAGGLKEEPAKAGGSVWSLEVEPGLTIRGLARGQGTPVIVLHGGPGFPSAASWRGLDAFADRHRFYYPHQRGSGWSDRPVDRFPTTNFPENVAVLDAKLGLVPQVADIERLRRALGVDRVDLVGHSFGGLLACLYALEFPQHVGRVLMIAPAALVKFPPPSGGLYQEIRAALPDDRLGAYDAWLKDVFDYGRLFTKTEADLARLNAAVFPFYREAAAQRGGAAWSDDGTDPTLVGGWIQPAVFFGLGQRHDWTSAFRSIASPVTLVAGDADLSGADDFDAYRVLPHLRYEVIAGATHFVADDPQRFALSPAVRDALE